MARAKRTSTVLETANKRLAGLKSITPEPILGPNLSVAGFGKEVSDFNTLINSYYQILSTADQMQNDVDAAEKALNTSNTRILSAVEAQFGPDSNEYEMVGGKRLRDRKRPSRTTPPKGSGSA